MTVTRYPGRVASPGVAYGTLRRDRHHPSVDGGVPVGLVAALVDTIVRLRSLQAAADGLGADILALQLEVLEDPAIVVALLSSAPDCESPVEAVERVFAEQIESFKVSGSERFAARASDLSDVRDRLLAALQGNDGSPDKWSEPTILLAEDMTPSRFLELDRSRVTGIVDRQGSPVSHVALLARSEGMPMLVGAASVGDQGEGRPAMLDAEKGQLLIDPPGRRSDVGGIGEGGRLPDPAAEGEARLPAGELVSVQLTVNSLQGLAETPCGWFDGIGLVRSELLVRDPRHVADCDGQAALYRPLFEWARAKPVSIRLFDAGGDKPLAGMASVATQRDTDAIRGAQWLIQRKDVLRTQLRAILRAAEGRRARIVVPMVARSAEMDFFRRELSRAGEEVGCGDLPELGMMVETPAAAIEVERFDADFYALGTNDLIQFTLGSSRNAYEREAVEVPRAVLQLLAGVIDHAARTGKQVILCGDVNPTPEALGRLLEYGLRALCVPARLAPRIKQFIRTGL